ncbi:MAG: cytidine deaminase [Alphaproteobacteria bacterium]|nr:cytidine deaminase [Alphaproteobacteria bacterium]TAD91515.1 MAG: cytidine deaminase [Alphaproteobacteria bacterium]
MDALRPLITAALAARQNAYAPYSRFLVGAAVLADGAIFAGSNVENAAYPQGQCAEASAIGAMVTAGKRTLSCVVVVGTGEALCTPCGGCRQRLREFGAPDLPIHLVGEDGALRRTVTLADLLPLSFGPDNLGLNHD